MSRRMGALLCLFGLGLVGNVQPTSACALDGKPSAFANSVQAVIVYKGPTSEIAWKTWWAHFAFPGFFKRGRAIVFREDDAQISRLLPAAVKRQDWRWQFGDGARSVGDTGRHIYEHPGRYRISVDAYFPGSGWQSFDSITVSIGR